MDSFESVYKKYYPNIEKIATNLMYNSSKYYEKEDVIQELSLELFRKWLIYDPQKSPADFFIKLVLLNKYKDLLDECWAEKRGLKEMTVSLDDADDIAAPETDIAAILDIIDMLQAVLELPKYKKYKNTFFPICWDSSKKKSARTRDCLSLPSPII